MDVIIFRYSRTQFVLLWAQSNHHEEKSVCIFFSFHLRLRRPRMGNFFQFITVIITCCYLFVNLINFQTLLDPFKPERDRCQQQFGLTRGTFNQF